MTISSLSVETGTACELDSTAVKPHPVLKCRPLSKTSAGFKLLISIAANFRRTALSAFPLAYYHCLLYCLVTRQTVREMMDDRLAADGVGMLSNSDDGRRGPDRGGVYVSTTQHVHTDDSASKASEQSSGTEVFALSSLARDLKGDWAAPV